MSISSIIEKYCVTKSWNKYKKNVCSIALDLPLSLLDVRIKISYAFIESRVQYIYVRLCLRCDSYKSYTKAQCSKEKIYFTQQSTFRAYLEPFLVIIVSRQKLPEEDSNGPANY